MLDYGVPPRYVLENQLVYLNMKILRGKGRSGKICLA